MCHSTTDMIPVISLLCLQISLFSSFQMFDFMFYKRKELNRFRKVQNKHHIVQCNLL